MKRRGAALVEFVVGLAVLAPVVIAGVSFVDAFRRLDTLEQAVIAGARFAATQPEEAAPADGVPPAALVRAVADRVLAEAASVPGLRREHVRVSLELEDGRAARVSVSIAGYRLPTPGWSYALNGTPRAAFAFRGRPERKAAQLP